MVFSDHVDRLNGQFQHLFTKDGQSCTVGFWFQGTQQANQEETFSYTVNSR